MSMLVYVSEHKEKNNIFIWIFSLWIAIAIICVILLWDFVVIGLFSFFICFTILFTFAKSLIKL